MAEIKGWMSYEDMMALEAKRKKKKEEKKKENPYREETKRILNSKKPGGTK